MKMYYITFRSITPAQRGQQVLRQGGIICTLQRTKRSMEERGCGYSLRIRAEDINLAVELLRGSGVTFGKIFKDGENGAEELML